MKHTNLWILGTNLDEGASETSCCTLQKGVGLREKQWFKVTRARRGQLEALLDLTQGTQDMLPSRHCCAWQCVGVTELGSWWTTRLLSSRSLSQHGQFLCRRQPCAGIPPSCCLCQFEPNSASHSGRHSIRNWLMGFHRAFCKLLAHYVKWIMDETPLSTHWLGGSRIDWARAVWRLQPISCGWWDVSIPHKVKFYYLPSLSLLKNFFFILMLILAIAA